MDPPTDSPVVSDSPSVSLQKDSAQDALQSIGNDLSQNLADSPSAQQIQDQGTQVQQQLQTNASPLQQAADQVQNIQEGIKQGVEDVVPGNDKNFDILSQDLKKLTLNYNDAIVKGKSLKQNNQGGGFDIDLGKVGDQISGFFGGLKDQVNDKVKDFDVTKSVKSFDLNEIQKKAGELKENFKNPKGVDFNQNTQDLSNKVNNLFNSFQENVKSQLTELKPLEKLQESVQNFNPSDIKFQAPDINPSDLPQTLESVPNKASQSLTVFREATKSFTSGIESLLSSLTSSEQFQNTLNTVKTDIDQYAGPYLQKAAPYVKQSVEFLFAKIAVLTSELEELRQLIVEYGSKIAPSSDNEYVQQAYKILEQLGGISQLAAVKIVSIVKQLLPDSFEEPFFNFVDYLLNNPKLPLGAIGIYALYSVIVNFFKNLAGFKGFIDPEDAYESLQEGKSVLVDIRNEEELLENGVVDLRLEARGKALWTPRFQFPRKKYKTFKQGQLIEANATAEIALGTGVINRSQNIYVMPSYKDGFARDVCRAFTRLGYRNAYIIDGGYRRWEQEDLPVKDGTLYYEVQVTDLIEDTAIQISRRSVQITIFALTVAGTGAGGVLVIDNFDYVFTYIGVFGVLSTVVLFWYGIYERVQKGEDLGKSFEEWLAGVFNTIESIQNKFFAEPPKAVPAASTATATSGSSATKQQQQQQKQQQQQQRQREERARAEAKKREEALKREQQQKLQQQQAAKEAQLKKEKEQQKQQQEQEQKLKADAEAKKQSAEKEQQQKIEAQQKEQQQKEQQQKQKEDSQKPVSDSQRAIEDEKERARQRVLKLKQQQDQETLKVANKVPDAIKEEVKQQNNQQQ